MARKRSHSSSRGVLTRLGKAAPSRKGPSSLSRKVLSWIGQGLLGIVLLALIGLVLVAMFRPTLGQRPREGDFKIEELRDGDLSSFPPEEKAVAAAVVHIQKQRVLLPVTAEQRPGLSPGREAHVRYAYFPRINQVRVDSWSPK